MAMEVEHVLLQTAVPLKEVMNFSGRQHWFFQEQRLHSPRQLVDIYIWLAADLHTSVHFVVDEIRAQYNFVNDGPAAEQAAMHIRQDFATYSVKQVRLQVRTAQDPGDRIEAIQPLGT